MAKGEDVNVFLFVPNLIGYARVVLAAASFYLMPEAPGPAAAAYVLSAALDALDGHAARLLGQGSRLGAMLDMLTDRLCSLCLQLHLAQLYPRAGPLLQLSVCTDIASHWLHLHCATLQGGGSHKSVGGDGPSLLRLYYSSRALLFVLCAGNEAFFCCLFLVYHWEGPTVFPGGPGLFRAGLVAAAPLAALKLGVNVVQLGGAARRLAAIDRAERRRHQ
ncbi:CDP-diacylglycerol--inositol 3-phosphatidyltransferase [Phaenicophaeus curvirostris]|uniref:CDP-diacylglycerol--inositol 3-phosphatidyltransferase n=1 Tax=Phaenicophaeus curvirostris TaxID=33595 RepID=UPI0037F0DED0